MVITGKANWQTWDSQAAPAGKVTTTVFCTIKLTDAELQQVLQQHILTHCSGADLGKLLCVSKAVRSSLLGVASPVWEAAAAALLPPSYLLLRQSTLCVQSVLAALQDYSAAKRAIWRQRGKLSSVAMHDWHSSTARPALCPTAPKFAAVKLLRSGREAQIAVYDCSTGAALQHMQLPSTGDWYQLAWSANGSRITVFHPDASTDDARAYCFDASSGTQLHTRVMSDVQVETQVAWVRISPHGSYVALGLAGTGIISVHSLSINGGLMGTLQHSRSVQCAWHPSEKLVASCKQGRVSLFCTTGQDKGALDGLQFCRASSTRFRCKLEFSSNGRMLLICHGSSRWTVVDVESGTVAQAGEARQACLLPDGRSVLQWRNKLNPWAALAKVDVATGALP